MTNNVVIIALPVGEFDTDLIKTECEAIIQIFNLPGVELVIADPVADIDNARQSVSELLKNTPDLLLIISLRGLSAQTIEAAVLSSHVPCLIYPVQGRFALPSSALAIGALREAKVPVELIYAPPDHPASLERLLPLIKAAKAYSRLRKSRVGIVGKLFANLVSCRYDPQIINSRLGVTLLPISFDAVRNSILSSAESSQTLEQAHQEICSSYKIAAADRNALDAGLSLHRVLKQIAREQKLDGFATECWSAFPKELGLNPCLGFIEDAYALACEGDVMLCISLLLARFLTGASAYVGDLYDLDLHGILTLVHCGAPASLASDKGAVVLGKSQLALERGFQTLTCRPRLDQGPVTVFRFYGQECDKLHLAFGELTSCEQAPNLTVKVQIEGNRQDFLDQCFGNHYLVVPGDIRGELKLLCKWLEITIFET